MGWYQLKVKGAKRMSDVKNIADYCRNSFLAKTPPHQAALYEYFDVLENVSYLYFSPDASSEAVHFNAVSCNQPKKSKDKIFASISGDKKLHAIHLP